MARGDVLQIVVFAFIFGAACAAIGAKARARWSSSANRSPK